MAESKVAEPKGQGLLYTAPSRIAGTGAFAARDLKKGESLGEYTGEIVSDEEADRRYEHEEMTYLFYVEDGHYIDAMHADCPLKYINHSCDPNCRVEVRDKRIFYYAKRAIGRDEELTIDYELIVDSDDKNPYTCACGTASCRGTMKDLTASETSAQDRKAPFSHS